jgi:hypothetical protein
MRTRCSIGRKGSTLTAEGQEFYSTLAADVANVLCTGHAWKLLAALPEPWEPPEGPGAVPVQFLSP